MARRIKVVVQPDGQIDVGERRIPSAKLLLPYVALTFRSALRHYSSVSQAVRDTALPAQVAADALRLYYAAQEYPGVSEFPAPASSLTSDAYLAAGDTVYHLVPVGAVRVSGALNTIRRRAQDEARVEYTRITTAASVEASRLVEQAVRTAEARVNQANEMLEKARRQKTFPDWLLNSGLAVTASPTYIFILFTLSFHIEEFRWGNRSWRAADHEVVQVPAQFPITWAGEPLFGQARLASPITGYLPHMVHSSCITVGDAPRTIESTGQFQRAIDGIARAFRIVNLGSLLCKDPSAWHPNVRAAIPPALATYIAQRRFSEPPPPEAGGTPIEEAPWTITTNG